MKVSSILDHIDSGFIVLPEFQRGYVWNRDQVRGFFDSLYRRHPVGGLLVWTTKAEGAVVRGDGKVAAGVAQLLLDGQQRITSLYGVIRGKAPAFFDGSTKAFTGLYFNVDEERFQFYQPTKMKDDPRWINVTELMLGGIDGIGEYIENFSKLPEYAVSMKTYIGRLTKLYGITGIEFHVEEVTGTEKSLDVIVEIFNKVNSGGTKLSQGDLALAKICADWPQARDTMKGKIEEWRKAGFSFSLDWLLRSVNTVLTGEAKFQFLHDREPREVQNVLNRVCKHIDTLLNLIGGRLGLDHDRVLFGRYAFPVMVRYLDLYGPKMSKEEQDKLLFWYFQAGMWGRFSGSTESVINKDISVLDGKQSGLDNLIYTMNIWHGGLKIKPDHFSGWSLGARFYPVLYMLTRMGEALDWGTGIPLKAEMLGRMSQLEVHHIFPKSQLYKRGYYRREVNALANFCFLSKETNLSIGSRLPEEYFTMIEDEHPGALASQWIPMDPEIWKVENFREFLEARKVLLAEETNKRLLELLHGETSLLDAPELADEAKVVPVVSDRLVSDENIDEQIEELNQWVVENGLPKGEVAYEHTDSDTGQSLAIFDLAWPEGIQKELSEPIVLMLSVDKEALSVVNRAGFKCFQSIEELKQHIKKEILAENSAD